MAALRLETDRLVLRKFQDIDMEALYQKQSEKRRCHAADRHEILLFLSGAVATEGFSGYVPNVSVKF